MALIVEDGTGLATAESYVSVVDCDAYHVAMNNAAWTGAAGVKEAALRKATQYIDAMYRFRGERLYYPVQALEWPRTILNADWPVRQVVQACCELALRALTNNLFTDQTDRSVKSETVGPISITYSDSNLGGQVRYSIVDNLLSQFTGGSNHSIGVERA